MQNAEQPKQAEKPKPAKSRYLQYALHAAVLAGVIVAGLKYVNGDQFMRALHRFNWIYAPFILLLTAAYVFVKAWRFASQLQVVANVRRSVIIRSYFAAQAATLLPGGIAARAAILEQAGVDMEESAASIALSSGSDQAALLASAIVSSLWFESVRRPVFIFLGILAVISVLLGVEATRTWLLGIVEKILQRVNLLDRWRGFLSSLKDMARPAALLRALVNALFAAALMVLALDLTVRGLGLKIGYDREILAFTLPSLLGRISAMPGGVGVTEAGMIPLLDSGAGVTREQAAAAVMLFRVGTVLFAAVLGGLVYFFGWRGAAEAKRAKAAPEVAHERAG